VSDITGEEIMMVKRRWKLILGALVTLGFGVFLLFLSM